MRVQTTLLSTTFLLASLGVLASLGILASLGAAHAGPCEDAQAKTNEIESLKANFDFMNATNQIPQRHQLRNQITQAQNSLDSLNAQCAALNASNTPKPAPPPNPNNMNNRGGTAPNK